MYNLPNLPLFHVSSFALFYGRERASDFLFLDLGFFLFSFFFFQSFDGFQRLVVRMDRGEGFGGGLVGVWHWAGVWVEGYIFIFLLGDFNSEQFFGIIVIQTLSLIPTE